jgi:N-acetylmuramoyl-L-alanine amidase
MHVAALAAATVVLTQSPAAPIATAPDGPAVAPASTLSRAERLAAVLNAPEARDALARVAWAEAGNQSESGLAGVVYTIINRLIDGRWGHTVEAVVDAPGQFEPVMRAGGTWRRLPTVTPVREATIHTIVDLALQGRLPDLTGGAKYFQNQRIVAARAAAGTVPPGLVAFGGAAPSARIGDQTFYAAPASSTGAGTRRHRRSSARKTSPIFFGDNAAATRALDPMTSPSTPRR